MCCHTACPAIKNQAVETHSAPTNHIIGSTRCAGEGCGKWAKANSRFCKDRKDFFPYRVYLAGTMMLLKGYTALSRLTNGICVDQG